MICSYVQLNFKVKKSYSSYNEVDIWHNQELL